MFKQFPATIKTVQPSGFYSETMWSRLALVAIFGVWCTTDGECQPSDGAAAPSRVPQTIKAKTWQRPPIILPLNSYALDKDGARTQTLVRPAVLPPAEGFNPLLSSKSRGQPSNWQGIDLCQTGNSAPAAADAVSLAVAFRQAQEPRVGDDRLFYGFRTLPVESPCVQPAQPTKSPPSQDENIYALNGQIVELQPSQQNDDLSEEAVSQLLDLGLSEEASRRPPSLQGPSLADLGYSPVRVVSAKFVPDANCAQPPTLPSVTPVACLGGFQAGAVAYKPAQVKILRKTRKEPQNLSVLASLEQRTALNRSS
ncbi:uncharacterized protein LOC109545740 isoform X1 [Dendroctonus ponderosae]|uniref:uncharacterized protein LOC109545740 isoform X1 n=1 Tax=Dendroctonus ponderosae TaxID=77166 RepID=UPI002035B5C8|nr:uncharacterized protein LOC109545740 isoform X1 [Dendroctonus ponderosae]KAH1018243.1 hypothetical protein HUJ05_006052 [Dendroctonus ponderosae]